MKNDNCQNRFKSMRKNKCKSQVDMAADLNITQSTISKWESGVSIPDAALLPTLADYFGVSIDFIMGRLSLRDSFTITQDGVEYSIPSNLDPRLLDGFARHDIKLSDLASLNDEQIALIVAMTQNLIDRHKK